MRDIRNSLLQSRAHLVQYYLHGLAAAFYRILDSQPYRWMVREYKNYGKGNMESVQQVNGAMDAPTFHIASYCPVLST